MTGSFNSIRFWEILFDLRSSVDLVMISSCLHEIGSCFSSFSFWIYGNFHFLSCYIVWRHINYLCSVHLNFFRSASSLIELPFCSAQCLFQAKLIDYTTLDQLLQCWKLFVPYWEYILITEKQELSENFFIRNVYGTFRFF